jgi:hypothetical protein
MSTAIVVSLAPGFSRVFGLGARASRFNGLPVCGKPLKRFLGGGPRDTGLKPGANEMVSLNSARINSNALPFSSFS